MKIILKPFGAPQTNCYIVATNGGEIIIDPGMNAGEWVMQNVQKPIAILNTHGHYDHIFSNAELKQKLNVPIYCPKGDEFMLHANQFGVEVPPSYADVCANPDEEFEIGGEKVKFHYFPGHTPGCSMIEIGDVFFSGDFIFKNSIGRTDFPYSNPQDMVNSLRKFATMKEDKTVYPGHGEPTTIFVEQKNVEYFITLLT